MKKLLLLLSIAALSTTPAYAGQLLRLLCTQNAAVQPNDIGGLTLWLDGDSQTFSDAARTTPQTTNGGTVKGWADLSGTGNHFGVTSVAGATLATNAINGHSVVDINRPASFAFPTVAGKDQTTILPATGHTIFAVVYVEAVATNLGTSSVGFNDKLLAGLSTTGLVFTSAPAVVGYNRPLTSTYDIVTNTNFSLNSWNIIQHRKGSGSQYVKVGTNQQSGSTTAAIFGYDTSDEAFIGSSNSGENPDMKIAEIITYNRELTADEIANVEAYLKNKYAL